MKLACGNALSWVFRVFILTMSALAANEPPTILRHPISQRTLVGDHVLFEVGATSPDFGPLRYQWLKNGQALPGETGIALRVSHAQVADTGGYQVVVANEFGEYVSDVAQLRLLGPSLEAGSLDQSFDAGSIVGREIESVLALPENEMLIGGKFSEIQSQASPFLARLNGSGMIDTSFNQGKNGPNDTVRAMALTSDDRVLIAGDFTIYNDRPAQGIVMIESNGTLANDFENELGVNGSIRALIILPTGKILVGGSFTKVNGDGIRFIARLLPDGQIDPDFAVNQGFRSGISSMAVTADGSIMLGGNFGDGADFPYNHLARLHEDGRLDLTFPQGGPDLEVTGIALQSDGHVFVGGRFRTLYGESRPGLARLLPDGTFDPSFPNQRADLSVTQVQIDDKDRVLVVGEFSQIAGVNRPGVARYTAKGEIDLAFDPMPIINAEVNTAALQADGNWLIGGEFDRPHSFLVRLLAEPPSVGIPSDLLTSPQVIQAKDGCRLCLAVNAMAYPSPSYTWRLDGHLLPDQRQSELRLTPFQRIDAGLYQVSVENVFGSVDDVTIRVLSEAPSPFAPQHLDFFSEDTPIPIPNDLGSSLDSMITVRDAFEVARLSISLDIEHDDANELQAELFAPGRKAPVLLFRKPGDNRSGKDFNHTVFDDAAPHEIDDGVAPFLGTFRIMDDGGLRQLTGLEASGAWRLRISDLTHGRGSGTLREWSLRLTKPAVPIRYEHWREQVSGDDDRLSYALASTPIELIRDPFGNLTFAHQQWVNATDIDYHYEMSSNLLAWEPVAPLRIARRRSSDRIEDVILTWRLLSPAAFYRLRTSPR